MAWLRLMLRARGALSSMGHTNGCGSMSTPIHPRHFSKKSVVESDIPSLAPVSTKVPLPSSGSPSSVKKKVRKSVPGGVVMVENPLAAKQRAASDRTQVREGGRLLLGALGAALCHILVVEREETRSHGSQPRFARAAEDRLDRNARVSLVSWYLVGLPSAAALCFGTPQTYTLKFPVGLLQSS